MSRKTVRAAFVAVAFVVLCVQQPIRAAAQAAKPAGAVVVDAAAAARGETIFASNCAFCHGRDAEGGESGPDLTRSKLVADDRNGNLIMPTVHNGRPDKGMPSFATLSDAELKDIQAFIHNRAIIVSTQSGVRRGVEVSDLQTGNKDAGISFFNGAGGCAKCHSASGDLAHIASKFQGLRLEMRMLYPSGTRPTATVTIASGKAYTGTVMYRDEWTIGLRETDGTYRSWTLNKVRVAIDNPVQGHIDLFPRYTDDDIHNLMAYLQTLQ